MGHFWFDITAILKVVLDTIPSMEPYGFLLGEPVHEIAEEIQQDAANQEKKEYKKPYRRYRNKPRKKPEGETITKAPTPGAD